MASPSLAPQSCPGRIPLAQIDAVVAARLGPTRGLGNAQPACFNRQVAMYLAARVGRWSTTIIGRFYGGRDHSTVCYGIQRIECLKETDPEFDILLADLKHQLIDHADNELAAVINPVLVNPKQTRLSDADVERIARAVTEQVIAMLDSQLTTGFWGRS